MVMRMVGVAAAPLELLPEGRAAALTSAGKCMAYAVGAMPVVGAIPVTWRTWTGGVSSC